MQSVGQLPEVPGVDHAVAVNDDLVERDAVCPARILARAEIESLGQDHRVFLIVHTAEVHPPSAGAVAQQQCSGAGVSTTDRVGLHADVGHVGRAVYQGVTIDVVPYVSMPVWHRSMVDHEIRHVWT